MRKFIIFYNFLDLRLCDAVQYGDVLMQSDVLPSIQKTKVTLNSMPGLINRELNITGITEILNSEDLKSYLS